MDVLSLLFGLGIVVVVAFASYGMATQTLTYPTDIELKEIEQTLLPTLVQDDPIFDVFPIVESARNRLRWVQKDNYYGLQQIRGLNGVPKIVYMPGASEYDYKPGVYGEFIQLDEEEVTERRQLARWDEPVSIDDLVGDAQSFLLQRRIERIRYIIWTLVTSGTFAVPNGRGEIMHFDVFPILTINATTPWSTTGTSTPTADIRAAQQLSVGQSVDFGAGAEIWMNQVTANRLLSNTNPNDWFGRRMASGATINSITGINQILSENNLPNIVIYDKFYLDDSGNPIKFIPNGKAVLIGRRTNGAALGEYRMTRNFVNPRLEPGPYTRVVDTRDHQVPGNIQIHDGHNGGPVIYFPGAIVYMNVG